MGERKTGNLRYDDISSQILQATAKKEVPKPQQVKGLNIPLSRNFAGFFASKLSYLYS